MINLSFLCVKQTTNKRNNAYQHKLDRLPQIQDCKYSHTTPSEIYMWHLESSHVTRWNTGLLLEQQHRLAPLQQLQQRFV